ncbi:hypothetical protein EV424DRAFT_1556599 [Suillus variegatus]|nr:hypothetical protein EV424DRAFT_1556599 [Suillus variegatus]
MSSMPEQGSLRLPSTQQRTNCMSESRRQPHCTKARAETRLTAARRVTSPHCQAQYRPIWATTPLGQQRFPSQKMGQTPSSLTTGIDTVNFKAANNSEDEGETHYLTDDICIASRPQPTAGIGDDDDPWRWILTEIQSLVMHGRMLNLGDPVPDSHVIDQHNFGLKCIICVSDSAGASTNAASCHERQKLRSYKSIFTRVQLLIPFPKDFTCNCHYFSIIKLVGRSCVSVHCDSRTLLSYMSQLYRPHCTKARAETSRYSSAGQLPTHINWIYHAGVKLYWLAISGRAAITHVAVDGTVTVITDNWHRHCQLESSNNGKDEGKTHYL